MNIQFKYKGQDMNRPSEQFHIDKQKKLKERVAELLQPIQDRLNNEPTGGLPLIMTIQTGHQLLIVDFQLIRLRI